MEFWGKMMIYSLRWFIGGLKRLDAEELLLERNAQGQYTQKDGAFLVRPSEAAKGDFSISVKLA